MNALITLTATAVTFFSLGAVLGATYGTRSANTLVKRQQRRIARLIAERRELDEELGLDKEFPA
ncbi:hypothetical protein [Actinocorallia aurantiaca]|uniref:Uncharacterized protein n=1 Tax=Actinocorallia aurantiaca TaxID=46204 RepID=A0ABN3UN76_9ACTN